MHPTYQKIGPIEIRTIEECSELIKAITKILRFGKDNYHPTTKELNAYSLKREIQDVENCLEELKKKYI